jgi:hypothetical protein
VPPAQATTVAKPATRPDTRVEIISARLVIHSPHESLEAP